MPFRKAAAAMAIALAIAMAGSLSSCAQPSPHPAAALPVKQSKAQAYSAAIAEVNDYLAAWHQQGRALASQRFMVPAERGPDPAESGPDPIVLRSGNVVSYQPYRWVSQDDFTLLVILDLHFAGTPGAWNSGSNGRFVTFTRQAGQSHYLMYFATGP
jgi:hypothetical protein